MNGATTIKTTDDGPRNAPAVADSIKGAELSTEMLEGVLDQSLDCIKVIGPDGRLSFMNRNGLCAMEIDDFRAVAGQHWWSLWPAESQDRVREAVEVAGAGGNARFEAYCPTGKGTPRWWDVSVSPLRDAGGRIAGLISISRDVTDRVSRRELSEAAAAEMRHRLQNAYALAGALLSSAARDMPTLRPIAENVLERLARLGTAQRLLLEAGHAGEVNLSTLLAGLLDPFTSAHPDAVSLSLPAVTLGEEDVRALALAIGELSTNSSKYGALGFGGRVEVGGRIENGRLVLDWIEHLREEASEPPASTGEGSGHKIVARAIAARRGRFAAEWRPGGLVATIELPVAA